MNLKILYIIWVKKFQRIRMIPKSNFENTINSLKIALFTIFHSKSHTLDPPQPIHSSNSRICLPSPPSPRVLRRPSSHHSRLLPSIPHPTKAIHIHQPLAPPKSGNGRRLAAVKCACWVEMAVVDVSSHHSRSRAPRWHRLVLKTFLYSTHTHTSIFDDGCGKQH